MISLADLDWALCRRHRLRAGNLPRSELKRGGHRDHGQVLVYSCFITSRVSSRYATDPLDLRSCSMAGLPWLGASLSLMFRGITVSKISPGKYWWTSSRI